MKLINNLSDWRLERHGETLLRSSGSFPMIFVGCGQESVDMYRGNFKIEDYVIERRALSLTALHEQSDGAELEFGDDLTVRVTLDGDCAVLRFTQKNPSINRVWFRVPAEKDECCWGCGEQMSYFNLRGRHFPLWTSEPGVGRDKTTYVTWRSDVENKAGGDYYNTNFPQPTYVSSRHYYLHADTTAYADFDFRHEDFHELQFWEVPASIRIEAADTFLDLLTKETAFFGRQPELPDWVYNGLIIGVQGGSERSFGLLEKRCSTTSRSPASGARTGAASASPPSASACSGTGISIRRCTRISRPRSKSSTPEESNSSATSIPTWWKAASCIARVWTRMSLPAGATAASIWLTSASSTAASST